MHHRNVLSLFLATVLLSGVSLAAETPKHLVAFVVGNGNYSPMRELPSAILDAQRVARLLKAAGFILPAANDPSGSGATINLNRQQLCEEVQRLRSRGLRKAHLVVFYYAGHGGQVKEDAYLIGTDAKVEEKEAASDLRKFGINLEDIVSDLKPSSGLGLIAVIDACLSGPAVKKTPSYGDDVLAAFSTSASFKAADGKTGTSSVFTSTLTDALASSMSFGDALKHACSASKAIGYTPVAQLSVTSDLAAFQLQVARSAPAAVEPEVGSPAWLFLTPEVKTGLTLRPDRGTAESGEIIQKGDAQPVAFCYPSQVLDENGTRWIQVQCEGWALSKNLHTGKVFLERQGNTFTVLGEILNVRTDAKRKATSTFTLEPRAKGVLAGQSTVADGYEWQRVRYIGWVALIGPSGKIYATYQTPSTQ